MSAPANDDFADAATIDVNTWLAGSNVGATAEAGEPGNNGSTVWWSFTPTLSGNYVVSTRVSDAMLLASLFKLSAPLQMPPNETSNASNCTNFFSKVQVFTGNAVSSLAEVDYTTVYLYPAGEGISGAPFQQHAYLGIPTEVADLVAFDAIAGTTYYIRVDSRLAAQGSEGNICLSVASCVACSGSCAVTPNVRAINTVTFGNFAAGQYTINYCGGAYVTVIPAGWATLNWPAGVDGTCTNPDPFGNCTGLYVVYNNGTTSAGFSTPSMTYATAAEAEAAAQGASVTINHTGGSIGIEFVDDYYSDNSSGSPNPTFYLEGGTGACTDNCAFAPTISNVVMGCTGNNLDVFLTVPADVQAGEYKIQLSNVVGFQTANNVLWFSPTSAQGHVAFYLTTPPYNTEYSGTITLTDTSGTVCSTYNFSFATQDTFVANGANLTSANSGSFSGKLNLLLQSSAGCAGINNCTVTLAASGGVTNPSGPITGVNFLSGVSVPMQFSFQGTAESLTATVNITSAAGTPLATVEFALSANLAVSQFRNIGSAFSCDPPYDESYACPFSVTVTNNGLLPSYGVQIIVENECTLANETLQLGIINPGQTATVSPSWGVAQGVNHPVTVPIQVQETAPSGSVYTFPTYDAGSTC